jgi:hypothetical protein
MWTGVRSARPSSSAACACARRSRSTRATDRSASASSRGAAGPTSTDTIERLLELLGELAAERKRRVVIVFDEFQEILAL